MPTFAELKARASKTSSSVTSSLQNTKDRYSSTPTAKTNWDFKNPPVPPRTGSARPSAGGKEVFVPPPPPQRRVAGEGEADIPTATSPPPVAKHSRPVISPAGSTTTIARPPMPPRPGSSSAPPPPPRRAPIQTSQYEEDEAVPEEKEIDWLHLSARDKAALFEWLDEFFASKGADVSSSFPVQQQQPQPPVVRTWNRPSLGA